MGGRFQVLGQHGPLLGNLVGSNQEQRIMWIIIIVIIFNLWVWLFPDSYLDFLRFGKNAKIESILPAQKEFQKLYENPEYIWFVRVSLGFALIVAVCFNFFIG